MFILKTVQNVQIPTNRSQSMFNKILTIIQKLKKNKTKQTKDKCDKLCHYCIYASHLLLHQNYLEDKGNIDL